MQFSHPEILYALLLLLIPIIVHLFQLRRFQKIAFSNVAFLKEATAQTRQSAQIKKWLTLLVRLLLLAAIIIAFAQPFVPNTQGATVPRKTVVYLDNSFSMQAKGSRGELLKRAIQDLMTAIPEDETITLITNTSTFKNTTLKAIKNEFLQLDYTPFSLSPQAALLKYQAQQDRSDRALTDFVFISDFQDHGTAFKPKLDTLTRLHLVKLSPSSKNNIAIDSAYISSRTPANINLAVNLKNQGTSVENLSVALYNNDTLIAKTATPIDHTAQVMFSLPIQTAIHGKIRIEDNGLAFDNSLFFNIAIPQKSRILTISNINDKFLKRIYTPDLFHYTGSSLPALNYNIIANQHLIVLNELERIPAPLAARLQQFMSRGGVLLLIPATTIDKASYATLLQAAGMSYENLQAGEKRITHIHYDHPIYSTGVFEKRIQNFEYPQVNSYYSLKNNKTVALSFENGDSFLSQNKNLFVFTAALNMQNSNFQNAPLIVPTFYNIAQFGLTPPDLYAPIGQEYRFEVAAQLEPDAILSLTNAQESFMPRQQHYQNKVQITTFENPSHSGIYAVKNKAETITYVGYNYSRSESLLKYKNIDTISGTVARSSVSQVFDTIKSEAKTNALWKWFVIFALLLLGIEALILKYFK